MADKPSYEELEQKVTKLEQAVRKRKFVEEDIIEWKNRYESAVMSSGHILYDWDSVTNEVTYGGILENILGYTNDEMSGDLSKWIEIIHSEDKIRFTETIEHLIATRNPISFEYRVRRKDGEFISIEDAGQFIKEKNGKVTRMIGFVKDISGRKRIEEALRKVNKQYQRLLEDLGDNFLIFSHRLDGTFTYASSGIESIFGIPKEEAIGSDWGKIIKWDSRDLELAGENIRNIVSGLEYKRMQMSFRHPDGKQRTVFISPHPTKNSEGSIVAIEGIAENITGRKHAEEKLRNSEGLFRLVTQTAEIGITNTDLISGKVVWDETCYKIHGYKPGTLINLDYYLDKIIHSDEKVRILPDYRSALASNINRYRVEYRIIRPDGSVRWLDEDHAIVRDENGNAIRTYSAKIDITKRKEAEEALRESEERYRSMMESMKDLVYICSPDYHVEYMNPAMVKRTGHNAIGELCFKAINGLDDKCSWCVYDKVQQGENCVTEIVSPKDGRIYNVSHSPIHHADGSISKLAIYRDITEMRNMEQQLREAQKMDAISTLAGGVAHEFNNTLMGIMGNIELLKMNFSEDEGLDKHLESMKSAGHRMSRLTDQLLAYAEGGKYQPKNLKIDDFVIETLPILEHDLNPTVRVEPHFQKDISFISADNAQMQMVLSAILANSNEAIEDEGIIRIAAENKDIDEAFTKQHPGLKPGSYVCLTIEDDGKGMDEETRNGIFEPFFTTKFQGRGMGMAAVYGIVRNHNGWISVDSEVGRGTKVQIYLPAIEVEIEKPRKAKAEVSTGSGTILMIEDEDVVVEVTQAMLEMLGYRVMVAKTGKDAIHIAETFDGQIDLALLDIKLPDIDGRNLYLLIMKARPDLKVIVFSGYAIDGPAREILNAGAQDFIQKPFSIATLSEKLKEVLEGK